MRFFAEMLHNNDGEEQLKSKEIQTAYLGVNSIMESLKTSYSASFLKLLCVHIFCRFSSFLFLFHSMKRNKNLVPCEVPFSHIPLRKFTHQPHGAAPAFPFPHILSLRKTQQCTFLIHRLADKWISIQALRKAPPPNQRFCLFQMPSYKSPKYKKLVYTK